MSKTEDSRDKLLSDVYEIVIELRTELRSRGGVHDRFDSVEERHRQTNKRVDDLEESVRGTEATIGKGLAVIGSLATAGAFIGSSVTFFLVFTGSKFGSSFIRSLLGAGN